MEIDLEIISPLILIFLGIHFFIFIIPPLRKKLSKKYIKCFNLVLLWSVSLFIMSSVLVKIGGYEYLPDDPNTKWIYSGSRRGFIFKFLEVRSTEACSLCKENSIKLIPLIGNLLILFTPLFLIGKGVLKKGHDKLRETSISLKAH